MDSQLGHTYTVQGYTIALNIYNFPNDYTPDKVVRGLRYLLNFQHLYYRAPSRPQIIERCLSLFDKTIQRRSRKDKPFLEELADVIGTFSPGHLRGLLDRIRHLEQPEHPAPLVPIPKKPLPKTVYADTQNVHNHEINQTVIKATQTLVSRYKSLLESGCKDFLDNVRTILIERYPNQEDLISSSILYLQNSTAVFYGVSFPDVFLSVWLWILDHPEHKEELEKRLLEELKEMRGKCTTGHLSRLVNVIQGFTDEEDLCIKMSLKDQCQAVVKHYLTGMLKNCQDEKVIEELTEKDRPRYKAYVKKLVLEKAPEWYNTYGKEAIPYIVEASNQFAQDTILK